MYREVTQLHAFFLIKIRKDANLDSLLHSQVSSCRG